MSDFSKLSKEEQELISRIRKKATNKKVAVVEQIAPVVCNYVAGKGNKEKCAENSETPYGFCKKHSRTVQAKKAKEEYEISSIIDSTTPVEEDTPKKKVLNKKTEPIEEEPKKKSTKKAETIEEPKKKVVSKEPVKEEPPKKKVVDKKPEPVKKSIDKKQTPDPHHREIVRSKKIHPNHWGRYEDPVSHIVFDKNTKEAYGVQQSSGKVSALKPEHVQICIRNKWNYNLPYGSDEDESDSIHDSDFDEDDEVSDEEDVDSDDIDNSSDEDEEDVDDLVSSDSGTGEDSDEELVDSDDELVDSDDDSEEEDDSDDDDDSDEEDDDSEDDDSEDDDSDDSI